MVMQVDSNGDVTTDERSVKTIFGIPCKGCTERSRIMGAGNWQVDAILVGAIILLGVTIYLAKRENSD